MIHTFPMTNMTCILTVLVSDRQMFWMPGSVSTDSVKTLTDCAMKWTLTPRHRNSYVCWVGWFLPLCRVRVTHHFWEVWTRPSATVQQSHLVHCRSVQRSQLTAKKHCQTFLKQHLSTRYICFCIVFVIFLNISGNIKTVPACSKGNKHHLVKCCLTKIMTLQTHWHSKNQGEWFTK